MIPATFGALLGFLGLVAPGLVYGIIAGRRRPPQNDSTFAEASRVALTSLLFSLATLAALWLLQQHTRLPLPDVGLWLSRGGKYASGNLGKVLFGLAAQVVIACGLAAAGAWLLTHRSKSRFHNDTVYGSVFRRYAPDGFSPWVHVQLDNDVEFWGHERLHDDRDEAGARMLVLAGDTLRRQLPDEADWQPIGENWDLVLIDADRIRYIQVIYRNYEGHLRGARTTANPQGKPRNICVQQSPTPPSVPSSPA